ncbi:unnamed protein product [Toxocara canis]|uniref:Integrase catalytic domain-containing protein n=1 Tax=Toxocara canis TaxID=6265 RepID=A0A183U6U9_TOXCA|nr:unnamed protein product [Toxocara canis]
MFDPRNIQFYRFTPLPFGVVASPFLLAATISWHLNNVLSDGEVKSNEDRAWLKQLVDEVRANVYVDNVMIGANTAEETVRKYKALKQIFLEASMNPREWLSNDEEVNRRFEDGDRAEGGPTRIQRLWKEGWGGDEILDEDVAEEWRCLTEEWARHAVVTVPRLIYAHEADPLIMHVFNDASKRAYATCAYMNNQLIYAKAALNSSKEISISRMELMAVVIGTRVIKFIESQLHRSVARKILWCDAECVLTWLTSRKALPVFVANRIKEIREAVGVEFRYVKTEENPADIVTKGAAPILLENYQLWWKGPEWLTQPPEKWPQHHTFDGDDAAEHVDGEEQCQDLNNAKSPAVHLVLQTNTGGEGEHFNIIQEIANRVSSWRKLKGVVAYMFRWRNLTIRRETIRKAQLRVDELERAENWILQKV